MIKARLPSVLILAALLVTLAKPTVRSNPANADSKPLVEGNSAFALKLYGELSRTSGNLLFSPYSISTAMGMTYAGARGNTEAEMKRTLEFPLDQRDLSPAFKAMTRQIAFNARKAAQELNIANAICLTGGDVSDEFKGLLKDDYDAEVFSGGLDRINGWVKKRTEGKIEKILDELNTNSVCVLLNAIYFKGTWETQFKKSDTGDAPFHVTASKQATVPIMFQKSDFQMLDAPDFQAADIPYEGNSLSMLILLPRAVDGLAGLEKQLTPENFRKWLGDLDKTAAQEVELSVPKYKLETGYDLVPVCEALGIKDAFNGDADFTGMGGAKGDLVISQIKHKACVEVNEEGTEAAAATAVEMKTRSVRQILVFRADHPFLFLIRDNQTGTILFMGRVVDPSAR